MVYANISRTTRFVFVPETLSKNYGQVAEYFGRPWQTLEVESRFLPSAIQPVGDTSYPAGGVGKSRDDGTPTSKQLSKGKPVRRNKLVSRALW